MQSSRSAAARTGQLLNLSDLARDADIAPNTAKHWLSILQASGIAYLLEPYHANLAKRMVKAPKLYFLDTGLCAYLTGWSAPQTLEAGAMSGAMLETWVVSELLKGYWHNGLEAPFHYYRDRDMKEIDLLIVRDNAVHPLEVKKSAAPSREDVRHFQALQRLKLTAAAGGVICLAQEVLPLTASAQEAFDALKHLALGDTGEELLREAARETDGRLVKVQFSWLKRGNAQNPSWENTVLGSIEIDGMQLAIGVNSGKREEAIRAIVAEALGERARYRATEIQSMEKLLADAPRRGAREEPGELADHPEVQAKIAEMMAKHYEQWVSDKIPALGGRTPLEAVADPAGREAVEALVRQIERDGERMHPPLDPAIVRRLRQRLQLG